MTTIFRRIGATIGSMALLSLGGVAYAQESAESVDTGVSSEATYKAGDGIHLSEDLLVHPRVELEGGYQSNVFFADDKDPVVPEGAPLMRVGVGAGLSTNTDRNAAPTLILSGDFQALWNQYLAGGEDVTKRSDLGLNVLVDAQVNPAGALGFELNESYVRVVNPPPAEYSDDADRDQNQLSARVIARPGGGALQLFAGATWAVDIFESNTFSFATRNSLNFIAGTKWQWLPKTQLNGDVSLGLVFVEDNAIRVDRNTATPLRALVGISTLITPNFGTILRVGYGNSFQSGEAFNSYLALAELRYAFGPMLKVAAGYSHDFADSVIGNYRADHAIYARFAAMVAGRLQLSFKGEVRFRDFRGVPASTGGGVRFCGDANCTTPDRSDVMLRLTPAASFAVNEWLSIGAHYTLVSNTTDAYLTTSGTMGPGAPGTNDSFGYVWNEFMVTAEAKF